jgi:hypothetical protein
LTSAEIDQWFWTVISSDADEIRKTQVVIVIPVVNPEGFVSNEYRSSMTSLTKTERLDIKPYVSIFGALDKTEVGWYSKAKHNVRNRKSDLRFR